jgi:hypothetical protein
MAAPGEDQSFEWPVITADRKGLYSRVYDTVFGAAGIAVDQQGFPNLRCKVMVATGRADFYPGDVAGEVFNGYAYVTPRYAIWYTKGEALLFKKSVIPLWEGIASLKKHQLLYEYGGGHFKALEKYQAILGTELKGAIGAQTGEAALSMLIAGRADVLVTSIELIDAAQRRLGVALPPDQYQIEFLDRNKYYPQFQNTDQGRRLAAIFDGGMEKLARDGSLTRLFRDTGGLASADNIDPDLRAR